MHTAAPIRYVSPDITDAINTRLRMAVRMFLKVSFFFIAIDLSLNQNNLSKKKEAHEWAPISITVHLLLP